MKAEKHVRGMRGRGQQQTLTTSTVCSASTTATATPPLQPQQHEQTRPVHTIASPTQDLRILLGGNATLRAETLWCLNTATNHHSLNSNQGIGELFGVMFPDSDVAKSFTCGKDKTGYIIRFDIGAFFKNELTKNINPAGPFVLMFDESLNQSNKKKQLDIHVRYWEDGNVRSRYFGSQFLGHGKAEDLLHHV